MHFFLLLLPSVQAAKLSFCTEAPTDVPLPASSPLLPSAGQMDLALRPGVERFQEDICRCLPRRQRKQPAWIEAELIAIPSQGETRVKYELPASESDAIRRLARCLGEPTVTFEAFPYRSDMVTEDGPQPGTLRYPLKLTLEGAAAP